MADIKNYLVELGLSAKEIQTYMFLAQKGSHKASEIARALKANRTSVYDQLKRLVSLSLIYEDTTSPVSRFHITKPEELQGVLIKEKQRVESLSDTISGLMQNIRQFDETEKSFLPQMTTILGDEINDFMHSRSHVWTINSLEHDHTWWGFQDYELAEKYFSFLTFYWRHEKQPCDVRLLTNAAKVENRLTGMQFKKRKMKYLTEKHFSGTTWVIGDFIILVNTKEGSEYLLEIKDSFMAQSYRDMFRLLWSKTR